ESRMRENRPYGSEGGEQRYCSPTPIGLCAHGAPIFAWIPASAGTTRYLILATSKRPASSRVSASLRELFVLFLLLRWRALFTAGRRGSRRPRWRASRPATRGRR